MTKRFFMLLAGLIASQVSVMAGNKIKCYFNRPVNNVVSTAINAVYLNNCMADTIVAYINRAKYSIDVAVYNYEQGSYASISAAINSAYGRGVHIRWIYDGAASNGGLSLLNSGIKTLGSPTTASYGIMHNKFMVIDAGSPDPADAVVLTGSFNWNTSQLNSDYNNAIFIQDSALAHAYTAEFEHMWGSTGLTPDAGMAKFGPDKSDLGRHHFTVDGTEVELYFSPSDGTNTKIQAAISSADADLYFGMYTFTDNTDANMIVGKYNNGVYVAGINDSYSNSYSPYTTFSAALGANFKVYNSSGIYHNKFMIVDQANKCSDPLVLTGSHNWTLAANTKNDENTLIIHNDTIANVYYQAFNANFATLGGTLRQVAGCSISGINEVTDTDVVSVYPNPSNGVINITYRLRTAQAVKIELYSMTGEKIADITDGQTVTPAGTHSAFTTMNTPGVYFLQFTSASTHDTRRISVISR